MSCLLYKFYLVFLLSKSEIIYGWLLWKSEGCNWTILKVVHSNVGIFWPIFDPLPLGIADICHMFKCSDLKEYGNLKFPIFYHLPTLATPFIPWKPPKIYSLPPSLGYVERKIIVVNLARKCVLQFWDTICWEDLK